jgi:hypothetical protein
LNLERLRTSAGLDRLGVADGAGSSQMLIAAAVIEMKMRIYDVVDVVGPQAEQRKLTRDGLFFSLHWQTECQGALNVIEIITRIVDVKAVLMLDEDRVDRKSDLATRPGIPKGMEAVHDEGPAVEQIHLCFPHFSSPSLGRDRGAKCGDTGSRGPP